MAAFTLQSETAVVHVIALMTGAAGLGQANLVLGRFAMTGVTEDLFMGAVEFVIGLGIVVEAPHAPAVGVVAQCATVPQGALVDVVLFMAGVAGEGGQLVAGVQVAFLAGYRGVQADEREARHVVVE